MSWSNDLRGEIYAQLKTLTDNVYYLIADEDSLYPHIVFNLNSRDSFFTNRTDTIVEVNIWCKETGDGTASKVSEDLADDVEELFSEFNDPKDTILPTFYNYLRNNIPDEDKNIRHIEVKLICQSYVI